jgi:hypothetical protein
MARTRMTMSSSQRRFMETPWFADAARRVLVQVLVRVLDPIDQDQEDVRAGVAYGGSVLVAGRLVVTALDDVGQELG